ncbi:Nicotinamide riboside kinase [Reichenbachiella faecimaris]|uniref:Nicotinamide riboside kinase n=1 Tax=Reichenbachiella faecimaris TaxID=692418 RepID=A0A1W2G4V9_REIFA|nr:ATP-binding protein [Reichenbachiella faecimaris]SMD31705.1 Nicotinamide riboside kinase [Reichenbachiella faecimaris]
MEKITKPTFKVVITGPECTGKSTLSRQLSEYFEQPWLPEYARTYLTDLNRRYKDDDLLEIAKGQINNEDEVLSNGASLAFFDTSIEVIKVWSEWKYKKCDPYILDHYNTRTADLYLLLLPDMAWEADPLRENPHDRDIIFDIYKQELESRNKPFEIISGLGLLRTKRAIRIVENEIKKINQ